MSALESRFVILENTGATWATGPLTGLQHALRLLPRHPVACLPPQLQAQLPLLLPLRPRLAPCHGHTADPPIPPAEGQEAVLQLRCRAVARPSPHGAHGGGQLELPAGEAVGDGRGRCSPGSSWANAGGDWACRRAVPCSTVRRWTGPAAACSLQLHTARSGTYLSWASRACDALTPGGWLELAGTHGRLWAALSRGVSTQSSCWQQQGVRPAVRGHGVVAGLGEERVRGREGGTAGPLAYRMHY